MRNVWPCRTPRPSQPARALSASSRCWAGLSITNQTCVKLRTQRICNAIAIRSHRCRGPEGGQHRLLSIDCASNCRDVDDISLNHAKPAIGAAKHVWPPCEGRNDVFGVKRLLDKFASRLARSSKDENLHSGL